MRTSYRIEPCRTALNRVRGMMFDWSINPYMGCAHRCTFCYVRAFEHRADRPSDDRYGSSVRVKINIAGVLARELERPGWNREHVVIGAATDPYQPAEGRFQLTRAVIRTLAAHRTPFSIITRGPLVVRDLDVLQEAARRVEVSVSFSVPTLDRDVWRTTEPATAPPVQRLRALRVLRQGGIRAGVAMAPILPGISDAPESMAAVVRAARAAGAVSIWTELLHLRPGTREHFLAHLARDWPDELDRYRTLYSDRAYLPGADRDAIMARLAELKRAHPARMIAAPLIDPEAEPEQLDLAI
ncbi:MAG: radical SAM protein [Candidatus Eisenbacteria bacterium]|uniref:Radical SAM protein n=1 Tax=Eiseniibacteriota bacterium TaxID=2212470 RepID=A0A9D6L715_UNCEI|nr:radical SAM protein [Candidatus Eisenbacteria bacterium]MBI3539014.1 radical SAM protein [Candidatus Eisenbacteria bacterium]